MTPFIAELIGTALLLLGVGVVGKVSWADVPSYILSQMIGAFAAAGVHLLAAG